jgi:hypothetical protein
MKTTVYIVTILLIILVLLFLFSKREIYTEIEIKSSEEEVWNTLVTFNEYPNWNPFIRNITGKLSTGSQLNITIYPVDADSMKFSPTLTNISKPHQLSWLGRFIMPGIFDGEHSFIITKTTKGNTRFVQKEVFQGILVPFVWGNLEPGTRKGFYAMNKKIKEKAEAFVSGKSI